MNGFKRAMIAALGRCLPEGVKNSIFHLSYHLARREYEWFAHEYSYAPHMEFGLASLARRLTPGTIVDIGAFEGDWSRMARKIWPSGRLILIEPNRNKESALRTLCSELGASLHCELLGAQNDQEVQFHLMESGSSIMAERSGVPRQLETRRLRTLDSLLQKIESPAFLKIDAQGYELRILEGAAGIFPMIEAVLLEVAVIEINEGAPLLHEVLAFMKARGFVVYDILEIHRRPLDRALNQVDLLFIREQSPLIADKRHYA